MRDIDIDKISEGIDYELVPANADNEQAWDVRILTGDFVESVIRYGNVSFDGAEKCLKFNFRIMSSPDPELSTDFVPLQEHAADILEDILERSYAQGTLTTAEMDDTYGDKFRTNDSAESTD
ncbi:MAG: hypothetical protein CMA07_06555 [Euryarchaeota archaeon]|nr:hypothetical protein [Euryarchaeota archaeon]|tara:strand:- start:9124 stop:9489 length:366 start_codon:yes stop_codon:yes gene_type:complete